MAREAAWVGSGGVEAWKSRRAAGAASKAVAHPEWKPAGTASPRGRAGKPESKQPAAEGAAVTKE